MFEGEEISRHNFRNYKFSGISLNRKSLPLPDNTYILDTAEDSISTFDFTVFDETKINNIIVKGEVGSDLFEYIQKSNFNTREIPNLQRKDV